MLNERGLSAARLADDADVFPLFDAKSDAFQRRSGVRRLGRISVSNVLYFDRHISSANDFSS